MSNIMKTDIIKIRFHSINAGVDCAKLIHEEDTRLVVHMQGTYEKCEDNWSARI